MDKEKIKKLLDNLDKNSNSVNKLVDSIIGKYTKDLDEYIENIRGKINDDNLSDVELDRITVELPVYIYFANEKLENLGVESDLAKSMKSEAYSNSYLNAEGTIPERESSAELDTIEEEVIEKAHRRAYKKLQQKVEKAENIYTGVKKVVDKRTRELTLSNMTRGDG